MGTIARAARPSFFAATLGLAACGGLDPSRLERLEYGMDRDTVAAQLESRAIPVMRFFAAADPGSGQDVLIDVFDGGDGGTNYALVSIDGRFAAATVASEPPFFGNGQWWREAGHWQSHALVHPWSPSDLRALLDEALGARRVPLEWELLAPIDAAHRASGRHTGDAMAAVLVVPLVLYLPYWAWLQTFGDDGSEAALAARTFLLAAPRATTAEQVIAALGPPASDVGWGEGSAAGRTLQYEHGRFSIHVGFRDGRLLWTDFGDWYDWAPAFVR